MTASLTTLLAERVLILDGAMGTMIQRHNLTEEDFRNGHFEEHPSSLKGNNDLLSLTRPDVIESVHAAFLDAGADIIETNTFSGTTIAQADYKLESAVRDINVASVKIARKVADEYTAKDPSKPRFVAGAMGPTNRTASLSPDVNDPGFRAITFDQLVTAYQEQAEALIETGVDALLIETVFDTLNAKAALFACQNAMEQQGTKVPLMISGTITDASGRTLSGQTTEAFLISLSHQPLLSIGLNCALGAAELQQYLEILNKHALCAISAYPNAGLPNEFGEYDQSPEDMGSHIKKYLDLNLVNILGGCCGTTPEHIREMAKIAQNYSPRTIPTPQELN